MSRYVITAEPDTPLTEIVSLFEANHIKRVPIVENEKVVGIVSRANILQVLASISDPGPVTTTSADAALHDQIVTGLAEQPWIRVGLINVTVHNGVVDLWGIVGSAAEKNAVRVLAETTPGVQSVNDYLTVHTGAIAG
jgi:osmotically-inducible protein OsmY